MNFAHEELAWYTCAIQGTLAALMTVVTIAPGSELRFAIVEGVLIIGALTFGLTALKLGRLPSEHWAHRSWKVRCVLSAATVVSTSMVVAVI